MTRQLNAIITIAYRDFLKFLRDRGRIVVTFIFPLIFIGILGGSIQSNLGAQLGYNFLLFVFIGTLGQTLFQSTASGVISLIEDRENDFSQEMFVSPISRYSIIIGKILGESAVAFAQIIGLLLFGFILSLIIHLPIDILRIITILPAMLVVCFAGGAFGVVVLSNLSSQKSANQVFPFLILPQFFLAGVFTPIQKLPIYLLIPSRIAPMTYAVDLIRGIYYAGTPTYAKVVLFNPLIDLLVISSMFVICITIGTFLFVRNERIR